MKSYKMVFNLYRIILINLSLIFCLLVWNILYNYILVDIDVSALHIKDSIVDVFRFLVSTGIFLILLSFILYKLFSMVYNISDNNLLECLRQKLLSEYRISNREASLQINKGLQVYAESPEYGIFFKISYNRGKAIIDRLASGDRTELECKEISIHDLDELSSETGMLFYKSEAYDEMVDSGFTITESD